MFRPGVVFLVVCLSLVGCFGEDERERFTGDTPLVGEMVFAGSTSAQPLAALLAGEFKEDHPQVSIEIRNGGTEEGIRAIREGKADIGMASRTLTSEEARGITEYQVAADVIAIVIHPENPIRSLTLDQLREIYQGKITRWEELGGFEGEIVPVARGQNSGTRRVFNDLVLGGQEPSAPGLRFTATAGEEAAAIANNRLAIGYAGFGSLDKMVKVVAIDGVEPNRKTALNGAYPLVRPIFFLTGPEPLRLVNAFIDFALSPQGQRLVEEAGWVRVR